MPEDTVCLHEGSRFGNGVSGLAHALCARVCCRLTSLLISEKNPLDYYELHQGGGITGLRRSELHLPVGEFQSQGLRLAR